MESTWTTIDNEGQVCMLIAVSVAFLVKNFETGDMLDLLAN